MNSNINKKQLHIEDNSEFFGGEMQPYVDASTKNYEQKLSMTKLSISPKNATKKISKILIMKMNISSPGTRRKMRKLSLNR